MLIATMSSIQASVQQIRSSLKKMEKLGNMLNSTEENKNIITTMKNNREWEFIKFRKIQSSQTIIVELFEENL